MHTPSSLSRECVCGWASLHASPSAEQCVPLDPDKPRFLSRSPDSLCPDQASTEHPFSFVCCQWLTFRSKPFLLERPIFETSASALLAVFGSFRSFVLYSKRPAVARTSYPRPKTRGVGTLAIFREGANVNITLLGPESRARNLGTIKPNVFSQPEGLLRKTLSCAYLSYQRADRFHACGFVRRRGIQGIQGIAPD